MKYNVKKAIINPKSAPELTRDNEAALKEPITPKTNAIIQLKKDNATAIKKLLKRGGALNRLLSWYILIVKSIKPINQNTSPIKGITDNKININPKPPKSFSVDIFTLPVEG